MIIKKPYVFGFLDSQKNPRKKPSNKEGEFFLGLQSNIPALELERIRREYERLISAGQYKEVEELERERGGSDLMLNEVISRIILNSENGRREELISAFRHRGYGPSWLEERSYDTDI